MAADMSERLTICITLYLFSIQTLSNLHDATGEEDETAKFWEELKSSGYWDQKKKKEKKVSGFNITVTLYCLTLDTHSVIRQSCMHCHTCTCYGISTYGINMARPLYRTKCHLQVCTLVLDHFMTSFLVVSSLDCHIRYVRLL